MTGTAIGRSAGASRWWYAATRSRQMLAGGIVVATFVLMAIFGPMVSPHGYDDQDLANALRPPFWAGGELANPIGTDPFGRDQLTRLMYGARISLVVAISAVGISGIIGIGVGVTAGYFRGRFENIAMRIADVQYSFPAILIAIFIAAFYGVGLINVIFALSLASWMTFARAARATTLSVRERDYMLAARAVGVRHHRVILRYVMPNILSPLIVYATFQVPARILGEATLSFLGLGVQLPIPSWGNMLSSNRGFLMTEPLLLIFPGVALMIVTLGFNQVGDGLRDVMDPRLRSMA